MVFQRNSADGVRLKYDLNYSLLFYRIYERVFFFKRNDIFVISITDL